MEVVKVEEGVVARPLHVLVPLIKEDLQRAETAGMPYYEAAGAKMLEAKPQMKHGEFRPWIKRNFNLSERQATNYIKLAQATQGNQKGKAQYRSMNDFLRQTGDAGYVPNKPRPQPWHDPVKEAIAKVNVNRLAQSVADRKAERDLQRKLALHLIDIGYKALATQLHPDKKGGSKEAMTRLNHVRDRLRGCA